MSTQTVATRHVSEFAAEVRAGLTKSGQHELPSKYLYDEVGSVLFEAICVLPEYGLTRADARLLQNHAREIVNRLPSPLQVAEQLALIWEAQTGLAGRTGARAAYLETHNFEYYAKRLIEILGIA